MPGKYEQLHRDTECNACHRDVNLADQCPDKKPKAMNIAIIGVKLMQNGDVIKKTCLLLDTCSTDSATKNLDYVEDVKNCVKREELTVMMNEVSLIYLIGKGA